MSSADKMMDNVILVILFGSLVGILADYTIGIAGTGNVTGASAVIVPLIMIFLSLGVALTVYRTMTKGK